MRSNSAHSVLRVPPFKTGGSIARFYLDVERGFKKFFVVKIYPHSVGASGARPSEPLRRIRCVNEAPMGERRSPLHVCFKRNP